MLKRAMVMGAAGLLLGACSSVPKELAYEPANQLVAYQPALAGLEGKTARWSGVISAVHNKADQSVIEVVYLPLKSNGVPEQTEQSPAVFWPSCRALSTRPLCQGAQPDGAWHHRQAARQPDRRAQIPLRCSR